MEVHRKSLTCESTPNRAPILQEIARRKTSAMSGPRIIFTRFASAASPKLEPWREHRRRVVGSSGEPARMRADSTRLAVVWQLVSANNRELARSADVFDDFQDAVVSAREAVDCVRTDSSVELVSCDEDGTYGWYLRILDFPTVICSRWYAAERERRQSVQLVLETLPMVTLAEGARQYIDRVDPVLRQLS